MKNEKTEAAKHLVTSIVITRAEGPTRECHTRTVASWVAAQQVLHIWSYSAPEHGQGYHKCDFTVTWADGSDYSGRFDLQSDGCNSSGQGIREQVRSVLSSPHPGHPLREQAEEAARTLLATCEV